MILLLIFFLFLAVTVDVNDYVGVSSTADGAVAKAAINTLSVIGLPTEVLLH